MSRRDVARLSWSAVVSTGSLRELLRHEPRVLFVATGLVRGRDRCVRLFLTSMRPTRHSLRDDDRDIAITTEDIDADVVAVPEQE
jgi:hypothetical protein